MNPDFTKAKMIRVQNHFKWASIGRGLATLSLLIGTLAAALFTGSVPLTIIALSCIVVTSISLAYFSTSLYKNRQLLKQIEQTGM